MVDSERMLAEIAQAGLLITADPDNADVVVINTCGFIAPAKAEAIEAIKHAVACKRKGTVKKVIVAGCLAQRMGTELFNEVKGIDAVVGLGERDKIAEIIKETLASDRNCRLSRTRLPTAAQRQNTTANHTETLGVSTNKRRLRPPLRILHDTLHSRQVQKQTPRN